MGQSFLALTMTGFVATSILVGAITSADRLTVAGARSEGCFVRQAQVCTQMGDGATLCHVGAFNACQSRGARRIGKDTALGLWTRLQKGRFNGAD